MTPESIRQAFTALQGADDKTKVQVTLRLLGLFVHEVGTAPTIDRLSELQDVAKAIAKEVDSQ
jgi:hypothetical protein